MTFICTVKNGAVALPPEASMPDGAKVRVEPVKESQTTNELTKLLVEIAEENQGLPADFAAQHDHYLYGTPQKTCGLSKME